MMKALFIEASYKEEIRLGKDVICKLPKRIGLVTTLQFAGQLDALKRELNNSDKDVLIGKGNQTHYGQITGCDYSSAVAIKERVDAFLFIGTGEFHPLGLALKVDTPVFCFNPLNNSLYKMDDKEIVRYKNKVKGSMLKFLNSEIIGILVSTKPGQNRMSYALKLKTRLENEGKKAYLFAFNTLNFNELENFPFIQCWVNTACPRLYDDRSKVRKPMINADLLSNIIAG